MRLLALVASLAVLGGCAGPRRAAPDDARFGHRFDGVAPDGRETMLLAAADSSGAFFSYPAVIDTLVVRAGPWAAGAAEVPVEVLVKGALPDACSSLEAATQQRIGHLVRVTLTMRRPQSALCAQVVRPFRFYLPLEGRYAPGAYVLTLNDVERPFEVRQPGS